MATRYVGRDKATAADAARMQRQIPTDTRTPTERFMGLPLPGRSALELRQIDERRAERARAPRLAYVRFLDPKEQRIKT